MQSLYTCKNSLCYDYKLSKLCEQQFSDQILNQRSLSLFAEALLAMQNSVFVTAEEKRPSSTMLVVMVCTGGGLQWLFYSLLSHLIRTDYSECL